MSVWPAEKASVACCLYGHSFHFWVKCALCTADDDQLLRPPAHPSLKFTFKGTRVIIFSFSKCSKAHLHIQHTEQSVFSYCQCQLTHY